MKYYVKDRGLPDTFFNGGNHIKGMPKHEDNSVSIQTECYNLLKERILAINQKVPPVSLMLKCTKKEKDVLEITAKCKALADLNYNDLRLMICLSESNIPYVAINGDKIHNFVFREWIQPEELKGKVGIPIKLTKSGEETETTFSYSLNSELFMNQLSLIFFVQDFETKTILQGIQLPLEESAK